MWQFKLRTAISVYFTLLYFTCTLCIVCVCRLSASRRVCYQGDDGRHRRVAALSRRRSHTTLVTHSLSRRPHVPPSHTLSQSPTSCLSWSSTLSVADLMSLQVTHSLSRQPHVSPGHTLSQSPTSCPSKSHTVSVADLMSLLVTHSLSRRPHVPPVLRDPQVTLCMQQAATVLIERRRIAAVDRKSPTLSVANLMSLQSTEICR